MVTSQTEPLTFSSTNLCRNSQDLPSHTYENISPRLQETTGNFLQKHAEETVSQGMNNCGTGQSGHKSSKSSVRLIQRQDSQEGSSNYDVPQSPAVPVIPPKKLKGVSRPNRGPGQIETGLGGIIPDNDPHHGMQYENLQKQLEQSVRSKRLENTGPGYVNVRRNSGHNSSDNNNFLPITSPQKPERGSVEERKTESDYLTMIPHDIILTPQSLGTENKDDDPVDMYVVPSSQVDMSMTNVNELIKKMVQEEMQYLSELEDLASTLGDPATLDLDLLGAVLKLYDFHRLVFKPELEKVQASQQLAELFTRNRDKFSGYSELLVKRSQSLRLNHMTPVTDKVLLTMKQLQKYKIDLTSLMNQEDTKSSLKLALDVIHYCLNSADTHLLLDSITGCPLQPGQYRPALRKGVIRLRGDGTSLNDKEVFAVLTETHMVFAKNIVDRSNHRPYIGSIRMESVSIGNCKGSSLTFAGALHVDGCELSKRIFCITASTPEEASAWMKAIRSILWTQAEALKALRLDP